MYHDDIRARHGLCEKINWYTIMPYKAIIRKVMAGSHKIKGRLEIKEIVILLQVCTHS